MFNWFKKRPSVMFVEVNISEQPEEISNWEYAKERAAYFNVCNNHGYIVCKGWDALNRVQPFRFTDHNIKSGKQKWVSRKYAEDPTTTKADIRKLFRSITVMKVQYPPVEDKYIQQEKMKMHIDWLKASGRCESEELPVDEKLQE